MQDIAAFFARSLEIADKAGISRENIVLDPGIGFGKTPEQSMTALARLDELGAFGLPLLVGASRKRFISSVVAVGAAAAARRLDRRASDSRRSGGARSSGPTTWRKPYRRCGWPRQSRTDDDAIRSSSPASSSMPAMA